MTASRRSGGRRPLGQHFLRSPRTVARILDALGASEGETVVEVGPGRGALTRPLVERGVRVVALELDARLAWRLRAELPEVVVVEGDALSADVGAALAGAGATPPVPLVGNLPYESATPMVRAFVRRPDLFSRLVVMVQKEVGERLAARAGEDAYGFLSVDVRAHAEATRLFDVGRAEFDPPPKVLSTVVRLVPAPPPPLAAPALSLAALGFSTRRKTLVNALSARHARERVREALAALFLPEDVRAERLSLDDFRALALALDAAAR